MITRHEIEQRSLDFGIHYANVQRDYVFGWLLHGVYSISALRDVLVLKGGNCFRKAYLPNTRFSHDLDFSTEGAVDADVIRAEFNNVCGFVQDRTGVRFDLDRSRVEVQSEIDNGRRVFDVRLYFKDFYGNSDHITISLSIDIVEFDRICLPVQERRIIHPYSDASACAGVVRCLKLEEMLATKLKCMLQRQHTADLYDLVYAIFINRDIDVNRPEVLSAFFRKTIFERSPGVARQLLLGLPLAALRSAWLKYIVAPIQGVLDFDKTLEQFQTIIADLFGGYQTTGREALSFFPSPVRTPILQAGGDHRLVRLVYDGVERVVEPYSLVYKRRKDGHGEEYLYVYDRTGGRTSGPGIKSLVNNKIQRLQVLEERFQPRYSVDLARAGEFASRRSFGSGARSTRVSRIRALRHGWRYTVECSYCSRKFKRMRRDTNLKRHKDGYGNDCYGRHGMIVNQEFV